MRRGKTRTLGGGEHVPRIGESMKSCFAAALLSVFIACTALAQTTPQVDLSGSWTFMWGNDPANKNPAELKQGAGTFTGTYINDAKDKCPIAGRMSSPTRVSMTIVCPKWEIKADGSTTDARTVVGNYTAYGNTKGAFQMVRN
jgi:hypothetical protein